MEKIKKILLIGGTGYIGSALYERLKHTNEVDTLDLEWFGNFSNSKNIKKDFDDLTKEELDKYDIIVFTAANSSVPMCSDIFDTFNNNVSKFVNLLKKLNKQKFIYASSSCVYDKSISTDYNTESDTVGFEDGLTFSKSTIDNFIKLTDIEYYGLRFGSVAGYSPNMRLDLMINAMTVSAITTGEVNVFNGNASRPILSIDDLCNSVITIIESNEDRRGIYNIASFNNSIFEIAQGVSNYMNVPLNDNGNTFTYDFSISSEKFSKEFNFVFKGTTENIIDEIKNNKLNPKWAKREQKNEI